MREPPVLIWWEMKTVTIVPVTLDTLEMGSLALVSFTTIMHAHTTKCLLVTHTFYEECDFLMWMEYCLYYTSHAYLLKGVISLCGWHTVY